MKASIKFREEKNPLMRAKVPIGVLGLPLISGVAVGDAAELRLDLATAFDSGPSFRVSYRPNDPSSPFSFVLKTDVGPLGLPFAAAPLAMTAEFSPFGRGGAGAGPSFCVFFKPRFGDFSITKSVRSDEGTSENGINSNSNSNSGKKANGVFPADDRIGGVGGIGRLFSGMEVMARSVLPLWSGSGSGSQTALKLRWGLRVPPELRTVLTDDGMRKAPMMMRMSSLSNLPLLVLNKISIERLMDKGKEKEKKKQKQKKASEAYTAAPSDATAEVVSRHLEVLQAEHGTLWQSLEKLHSEIVDWKTAQSLEKLRAEFIDWNTAPVVAGRASDGNGEVSGEFCEVPGEFRR